MHAYLLHSSLVAVIVLSAVILPYTDTKAHQKGKPGNQSPAAAVLLL